MVRRIGELQQNRISFVNVLGYRN